MRATAPREIIVITAGDHAFMPLMRGMVSSLRALPGLEEVTLGILDLGLDAEDRSWLATHGATFARPRGDLGVAVGSVPDYQQGYLCRPFLRDYFPGFSLYLWVDGDAWLQTTEAVEAYRDGALAHGLAVAHEHWRDYRFQPWLYAWTAKHMFLGLGALDTAWLLASTPINSGVFCLSDTAPHWDAWAGAYGAAIARSGAASPHDQFALNRLTAGGFLGRGRMDAAILPPRHNWICDRLTPMWNDEANGGAGAFCEPRAPHATLGVVHLAGPAKTGTYAIQRTGGGTFQSRLTWGAGPPVDAAGDASRDHPVEAREAAE